MPESERALWLTSLDMPLIKLSHKISSRMTDSYAVHDHDFYELLYVVTGDVSFFITGHEYRVKSGSLLTFSPKVMHGVLVHSTNPYERYTLHFAPEALSMERRFSLLSVMPDSVGTGSLEDEGRALIWERMEHSGVVELLEAFEKLRDCDGERRNLAAPVYTEAVLSSLYLRAGQRGTRKESGDRKVTTLQREIISYVNQHYTENVSLDVLGEEFCLSSGYVNVLFKKATGQTVKDYVRNRRMTHARMLLASGIPSSQAAGRAGFGDYTTFYRAYVKQFGHAPSVDESKPMVSPVLAEALIHGHEHAGEEGFSSWQDQEKRMVRDPAMYDRKTIL